MVFEKNNSFENKKIIEKEITEKEILERLKLYHSTTKEKWEKIKKQGALLSEKELVKRGMISKNEFGYYEDTSTGYLDREEGRDEFVFASHKPQNYGDVILEIDLSALNIEGTKVATAGEWLHYAVDDDDKEYFRKSIIEGKDFINYLIKYINSLPNKEWFFGGPKVKDEINDYLGEALLEKNIEGKKDKFRNFNRLSPEIMFPKELPLKYIKNVEIKNDNYSDK